VVCADIDLANAQHTVELALQSLARSTPSVTQAGGAVATAVRCDVADAADMESLAQASQAFFGSGPYAGTVNLVINNAGIGAGGRQVGRIGLADWKRTVDINLWGVIHGCELFTPLLREHASQLKDRRVRGVRCGIINTASTASFSAAPLMAAYNVTKSGVLALSETLSAELAGAGVHVTALCPTFVKTNITRSALIEPSSTALADRLMKWTGWTPERVAAMTLDAVDAGQLYVLPQSDAQLIWTLKRLTPRLYTRGAGLLNRLAGRVLKLKEI
jgi:NAD(P)-dependent dehydrogenase (short-subunit alcohol dehydrogenase family)